MDQNIRNLAKDFQIVSSYSRVTDNLFISIYFFYKLNLSLFMYISSYIDQ